MEDKFSALLKRLEVVTTKLETMETTGGGGAPPAAGAAAAAADDDVVPPSVSAFDAFLSGPVAEYVTLAGKIGMPETLKQAELVKKCFEEQRALLLKASKAKKPSATELQEACKSQFELVGQIQGCATSDRRAADYNHRQAMSEAVPAMGWVLVEKTPGRFYANKNFASEVGTAVLDKGQLEAERYIATNRFRVKNGPKFEQRWAERKSRLADLDGFRFFSLLRRVGAEKDGAVEAIPTDEPNYVSLTVWEDKDTFTAWRTGEAFKEAHGGGSLWGFVMMLVSSTQTLEGGPKPAFYDGLLPLSAPVDPASPLAVVDGWRKVEADGVNLLDAECFVAMNRFKIAPGQEAAFEQRWARRESKLKELPGFVNFNMLRRDAETADDGFNFVSCTVWKDRAAFNHWRESQSFNKSHGGGDKPADAKAEEKPKGGQPGGALGMMLEPPAVAFYEGKLMLQSPLGA